MICRWEKGDILILSDHSFNFRLVFCSSLMNLYRLGFNFSNFFLLVTLSSTFVPQHLNRPYPAAQLLLSVEYFSLLRCLFPIKHLRHGKRHLKFTCEPSINLLSISLHMKCNKGSCDFVSLQKDHVMISYESERNDIPTPHSVIPLPHHLIPPTCVKTVTLCFFIAG